MCVCVVSPHGNQIVITFKWANRMCCEPVKPFLLTASILHITLPTVDAACWLLQNKICLYYIQWSPLGPTILKFIGRLSGLFAT